MPPDRGELEKHAKLQAELERRQRESALDFYKPYPKQTAFHDMGARKRERLLMAANRVGKSYCGAAEVAMHLTGRYPDWWDGRRFSVPVQCWAASDTGLTTRDVVQTKLCGKYGDPEKYGTGMIPRDCVDWAKDVSLARGVTDAFDTVLVKHVSGGKSSLAFKTYEQGVKKWQGETLDFIWFDEEPPEDIYTEGLTRTSTAPTGGMGFTFITFTPLLGYSNVVALFMDKDKITPERGMVTMTLEDAEHYTPEARAVLIAGWPAHQREARSKGIPMLGSGAIFPIPESMIEETAIENVPNHWPLLWSIDFGSTHPFGAVLNAWDRDADCIHVIAALRMAGRPIDHAAAMKPFGPNIPVAWPHDGESVGDKNAGISLKDIYKNHGLKMLPKHAAFKDGGISTEAGIQLMTERMTTGRYKVAKHLGDWWEEFRLYHRKDGLIVKERDDLMSASRVGVMALRHAKPVGYYDPAKNGQTPMAKGVDIDPFTGQ